MVRMRFLGSAFFGAALTLLVFYFMNSLVQRADARPMSDETIPSITFGPVDIPDIPDRPIRPQPPEKPKPVKTPPVPKQELTEKPPLEQVKLDIDLPTLGPGTGVSVANIPPSFGPGLGGADGPLTMLVFSPPIYPQDAAIKGLEGWVRVEFTVNPDGTVSEPRVVEAMPAHIFNRAALQAVLKWKFKPETRDGNSIKRRVTQRIDFTLPKA